MEPSLLHAYQIARYVVQYRGEEQDLLVNQPSLWLDLCFDDFGARQGIFITADNPKSIVLSKAENRFNHEKLLNQINQHKWRYLEGYSTDPQNQWPKENSLLIFDIDESTALALARKFRQNAILILRYKQPTKLLICE